MVDENEFQSTLPARGATRRVDRGCVVRGISIHAPRTGSDPEGDSRDRGPGHFNPRSPHGERRSSRGSPSWSAAHFNPRSPHGERQVILIVWACASLFQSTLPARGATTSVAIVPFSVKFQSTIPARGATRTRGFQALSRCNFNPRSPHGERPAFPARRCSFLSISIHAPRTGSDV